MGCRSSEILGTQCLSDTALLSLSENDLSADNVAVVHRFPAFVRHITALNHLKRITVRTHLGFQPKTQTLTKSLIIRTQFQPENPRIPKKHLLFRDLIQNTPIFGT